MDATMLRWPTLAGRLVIAALFLSLGTASAGVVDHALIPNTTGGTFISCRDPLHTVGIARTPKATMVFQTGPSGVLWMHRLPPMISEYDQYYVAPDGSAAVIALSPHVGNVYLVTEDPDPLMIRGAVAAVDFQGGLVLIVTAAGSQSPWRARVYRLDSGQLVGDTTFKTDFGDDFRYFTVRLSADGQFYYYLYNTRHLVTRDAMTGRELAISRPPPGPVDDVLFYSARRGYLVVNSKVYSLESSGAWGLVPDQGTQVAYRLIESQAASMQPVVFASGWGVFRTDNGQWLLRSRGGSSLHSRGSILTVVDNTADSNAVKVYDFAGAEPELLRMINGSDIVNKATTCANEYGIMNYTNNGFVWRRIK